MRLYQWKNVLEVIHSDDNNKVRGRISFKTLDAGWVNSQKPTMVLVSPYSAFHEGINGDLKMNAMISTIKTNIQTPVSILIADTAHLETLRLKYADTALDEAKETARKLVERYKRIYEGCNLFYWHSLIHQSDHFPDVMTQLHDLFRNDIRFQELLLTDATGTYTEARGKEFPDKELFVEKAVTDIIDQCACLLVLAKLGYHFQFYPGSSYLSTEYANRVLLIQEKQIEWVHVCLSMQSKSSNLYTI